MDLQLGSYKKVLFISDLFKVDDRSLNSSENPQTINILWLKKLLENYIERSLSVPCFSFTGDELSSSLNRLNIYRQLNKPFSSSGWASLYLDLDGEAEAVVSDAFSNEFSDCFIFGFELPPSHISLLEKNNISYIDLTIHPLRFLRNYVLGFRTNIKSIFDRAYSLMIPNELIEREVAISKARTQRIFKNRPPLNSALFLGQIDIDASLICKGGIAGIDSVEAALQNLSLNHEKVFYKFHPHLKDQKPVQNVISKIKNCEQIEVNVYDALASTEFSIFASLSSGSLYEASLFGGNTKRYLAREDVFDISGLDEKNIFDQKKYITTPNNILSQQFWDFVLSGGDGFSPEYCENQEWLKYSLNQKWGR